jgi:hypothetical protein
MQRFIDFTVDSGASYDLTTSAIVAAALGITDDAALQARVTAYSKMVADLCDRPFVMQNVTESFRISPYEDNRVELKLDRWPVQEILSITENDVMIDPAEYEFNKENGLVWRTAFDWWGFCSGLTMVEYISGYYLPDEAPPALALATTELIRGAQMLASGQSGVIRSISHGDRSVTYAVNGSSSSGGFVSSAVLSLIEPYRRLVWGG